MRNAIIEIIGNLIKEVANSEEEGEPGQQKRELENFFGLLFDRFLDLNGFVRSKVVQTFSKVLDIQTNRFAADRLRLTSLAVRSLEDKTSTVRKNCIGILSKLILTHPYGALHGGELEMSKFQEGYEKTVSELAPMEAPSQAVLNAMSEENDGEEDASEEDRHMELKKSPKTNFKVKREELSDNDVSDGNSDFSDKDKPPEVRKAKATTAQAEQQEGRSLEAPRTSSFAMEQAFARLDHDQLTKLRLTKRYYSDALTFITELEKAVPQIEKLLASKVRSEVLESMDFFKVAYEYKIESAEVGPT